MSPDLGQILVSSGAISEGELREAQAYQRNGGIALGEALLKLGFADDIAISRGTAKEQGMPFVDLDKGKISVAILERVPAEIATEQGLVPLMEKGGKLILAIDDPFKRIAADQMQFMLGCDVACALATPAALKRAIERYYGATGEEEVASSMGAYPERTEGEETHEQMDTPAVSTLVARSCSCYDAAKLLQPRERHPARGQRRHAWEDDYEQCRDGFSQRHCWRGKLV